jgi:uncharacterized membrane protein YdbT with pleckstrin-like domain
MGYIDDSLVPGEEVIYRAKTHWAVFVAPVIWLFLLTYIGGKINQVLGIFLFLFSLVFLIRLAMVYFTTEFALTDRRIIAKTGFINRHSLEIILSKVESLSISQSLDGRIFGFGTVTVIGSGGTRQAFPMISDPMELRRRVNTQIAQ